MKLVRAVIKLEVPEYQIGQPATIYFKDTMQKFGICDKEQEFVLCKDCYKQKICYPEIESLRPEFYCADGKQAFKNSQRY